MSERILKQLLELLDGEAGVLGDFSHRESVDWIVARNHHHPHAVAHDRVLSFADDLKACLLQRANGGGIVDAWQLGHGPSDSDDLTRDLGPETGWQFGAGLKVLADGIANILQGFLSCGSLAATTGEFITPDGESFVRLDQRYGVIHGYRLNSGGRLSSRHNRGQLAAFLPARIEFCFVHQGPSLPIGYSMANRKAKI